MALLKSFLMSAKNRDYDPMSEDGYDSKIPLHNDEAFQHGIHFEAKFIGSLEVPKPTSRVEIVAAMRRIRYEFKAKSVKKRKVDLSISVDGIKVSLWKKKQREKSVDDNRFLLLHYPIYRVFYVSHDSQDLKIFSFIARDNVTNAFRCNVFKAFKKNEAMRIVRTIGQAFEVCHKLSLQQRPGLTAATNNVTNSVSKSCSASSPPPTHTIEQEHDIINSSKMIDPIGSNLNSAEKTDRYLESIQIPLCSQTNETKSINLFQSHSSSEFTLKHQMQFMQEQLQQMQQESELAFNQIKMIKEQLNIEIAARVDAQNKNNQLLQRNRELLSHIQQLLIYTNKLESKLNSTSTNFETLKNLPTRPTDLLLLPSLFSTLTASGSSCETSNQPGLSTDSPDSGKGKEISSESISDTFLTSTHEHLSNNGWNRQNSTKTFSIVDDLTTQSISINDNDTSMTKTSRDHHRHHHNAYSSTSPSLTSNSSSTRSSPTSMNVTKTFDRSPMKTIDHHVYHQISSSGLASFTNSAFTQSPHRIATKEFDPFAK